MLSAGNYNIVIAAAIIATNAAAIVPIEYISFFIWFSLFVKFNPIIYLLGYRVNYLIHIYHSSWVTNYINTNMICSTRKEAKLHNEGRYYPSTVCKKCHELHARYTSSGNCVNCTKIWRSNNKHKDVEYSRLNKDKRKLYNQRSYEKHKESRRSYQSEYHARPDVNQMKKEYREAHKITVICEVHGPYKVQPYNVDKHGCPICNKSKGELKISELLSDNQIDFFPEYTFTDCVGLTNKPLRFDFYIPTLNILIEYDGQHHFHPVRYGGCSVEQAQRQHNLTKVYDEIKNKYASKCEMILIRIPHFELDQITIATLTNHAHSNS